MMLHGKTARLPPKISLHFESGTLHIYLYWLEGQKVAQKPATIHGLQPVKKSHSEGSNKGAMTSHHIAFELLKHQIAFYSFQKESRKMYPRYFTETTLCSLGCGWC